MTANSMELSELDAIIANGTPIEPIPLLEPTDVEPISPIMYTADYTKSMAYLRALMAVKEYSERALQLTAYVIALNPAHYTVWTYRADCLFSFGTDLTTELAYIERMADESSKNYQIWHHREVIMSRCDQLPSTERLFLDRMLAEDSKNYHVWCYRQWLCRKFKEMRDADLEYTTEMIRLDIYNNSAWNHRYFLLFEESRRLDQHAVDEEIDFIKKTILLGDANEAAWSYLRGVLKASGRDVAEVLAFTESIDSVSALQFRADILAHRKSQGDQAAALEIYRGLESRDSIRRKYWSYKAATLVAEVK